MGQLCPATKEELRSSKWEGVAAKLDPGALLTLIQSTCLNGNDKNYYHKKVISALRELVSNHQGTNSPSEFAEVTKTVLNTFKTLVKLPSGQTFSGLLPGMREHAICASDKFNFDVKDYESPIVEVKQLVHQECEDIMIGCIMTVLSNPARSDTYLEARRNWLAGNLGGHATDSTSAVNILVGNELLKTKGSNSRRASNAGGGKITSNGDTSESLVFVGVTGPADSSDDSCWTCGAADHIRYDCPKLSEKERQTHGDRRDHYKKGRGNNESKGDKMKAAAFMHLGNELSDSESDNEFWDEEDSNSGESGGGNEVDKNAYGAFNFCQFTGDGEPSNWDNDSSPDGIDEEDSMDEVEDVIDDSLTMLSEVVKLERVLSAVAVEQGKPTTLVNTVTYKFGKIGIFTIDKLHEILPTLNQRLKIGNYSTFHRTTLAGISAGTSKSLELDFRRGQA